MTTLSINTVLQKGGSYTFYYNLPRLNPMVNNNSLMAELQNKLSQFLTVNDVQGVTELRIVFTPEIPGASVDSWNRNTMKPVIDNYVWGEVEFIKAMSGSSEGTGGLIGSGLKKTAWYILGALLLVAIILFARK